MLQSTSSENSEYIVDGFVVCIFIVVCILIVIMLTTVAITDSVVSYGWKFSYNISYVNIFVYYNDP